MTSLITGRGCQHSRSCDWGIRDGYCGKNSLDTSFPDRPVGQTKQYEDGENNLGQNFAFGFFGMLGV